MDDLVDRLQSTRVNLPAGSVDLDTAASPGVPASSTMSRDAFESIVGKCQEYIRAGDVFQVVPSQRMERHTEVDPFAIYRALRIVNPSPYMIYMQSPELVLVASSPEKPCW